MPVNVTEHEAVPPEPDSVQLGALKVPADPLLVQLTVPVGVLDVLGGLLLTVAVQVLGCPVTTVDGEHATLVVVPPACELTVPLPAPLLALPECTVSLGVYVPVMVAVPDAVSVNVTLQLPLASVQLGALNVPAAPDDVKLTVPAGVDDPAQLVSATVAVHVEGWLIATVPGLQTMVVEVVLKVPVTLPLPAPLLLLAAWTPSFGV